MNRPVACVLIFTAVVGATCTHRVTQPSTRPETIERLKGWPERIEGVVLRNGRVIQLPSTASVRVQGDSLLIVRQGTARPDSVRIADVSAVVIQKVHAGRTVAAVVVVSLAAVAIIALAAEADDPEPVETSCPIIYAYNGSAYAAVAEPLGGAVSRGLQRTDLSRLEGLVPLDGEYHVLLANEMREVQHLDAFSLIAADHPENTTLVADRAGNLYASAATVAPVRAASGAGDDLLPALTADDSDWWSSVIRHTAEGSGHVRDTITLAFPRPAQAGARLLLRIRTSQLGAHTLKTMLDLWGSEVDHWYGLLDGSAMARKAHGEWVDREELWVLRVWVREVSGWVAQNVAVGGGPYISELQAIPLDLSRVQGPTVDVRVHPARGYWDFDFVGLDTAQLGPPRVTELQIADADPLDGQDVPALLRNVDDAHLVMAERGRRIGLKFTAPPVAPGMTRTVFSRSTGYYRIETDRTGTRQAARLDSLWLQPGYGVKLAEEFQSSSRQRAAR